MPNVQLNDIGTSRGIANFTIRGVGINSSIPSVDPTVGMFIDGMYLGINSGVVLDTFDLEAVEVLRGPQGLLFGRNVTGGAVLLRTRAPSTTDFTVDGKAAVETGLNYYAMGSVSGPIVDSGRLAARLSVYYNNDEGWFENKFDGNDDFGAGETWIVRPSVSAELSDSLDMILRYEHGDGEGDGPAAQNHAFFDRDSFDFSIDNDGFNSNAWDQAIWETNWRIGFGDGTITNILGWRDYEAATGNDIDGRPLQAFHARSLTFQDQWSNELRYSGTFDNVVDLTAGLYYFTQDTAYTEERVLPGPAIVTGGGVQDHSTWGAFSQFDLHLTDTLTMLVGARYTYEEKEAHINVLAPINVSPCSIAGAGCTAFTFNDVMDWDNVDGKLGLQWQPNDDVQVYGFWTSGFRSGGYNFRVSPTFQPSFSPIPGPTEPEEVDAYEIGLKYDDPGGRFRLNLAAFQTEIENMQRELNLPGALGVAQFIRNTADATLKGFEAEGQLSLTDTFFVSAFAGYTDGTYDRVGLDLSCNGLALCAPVGGPDDLALEIPRVAPWSYGIGFIHDLQLGDFGLLTSRLDFSHRDEAPYTDNNIGFLNSADMLDASFGFSPDAAPWVISLYGKNLLDEVTQGGDTILPPIAPFGGPGASFTPLNKGRVVGIEAQFRY
jgi:iron complex outermembrane receptor protein